MEITLVKTISLSIMFICSFIMGILPRFIRRLMTKMKNPDIIISSSLCYGAGILMATIFLHLFVEVEENVIVATSNGYFSKTNFPIAYLIICSGFFMVYFLEEMIHLWVHKNTHTHEKCKPENFEYQVDHKNIVKERCESHQSVAVLVGCEGIKNPCFSIDTCKIEDFTSSNNNCRNSIDKMTVPAINEDQRCISTVNENQHTHSHTHNLSENLSTLRSILIVLALSLHGIFEGLAVGLENNEKNIWLMLVAVTTHKIFIAFSIGMELLEVGVKIKMYFAYMIIFSLASPLGGFIAMVIMITIENETPEGQLVITILQGLSAGTILYVTFCEVLERERSKTAGRIYKFFALIAGFITMGLLEFFGGHNHNHNHSHNLNQNE